mgnify:CR=1 FL=1
MVEAGSFCWVAGRRIIAGGIRGDWFALADHRWSLRGVIIGDRGRVDFGSILNSALISPE